jgi:hypothetical protein
MTERQPHGSLATLFGTALTGAGTVLMQYAPVLLGFVLTVLGLILDYFNRRANKHQYDELKRGKAEDDAASQRQHEINRLELLDLEQSIRLRQLSGGPVINGEKTVCLSSPPSVPKSCSPPDTVGVVPAGP